jgi:hypothetical protein
MAFVPQQFQDPEGQPRRPEGPRQDLSARPMAVRPKDIEDALQRSQRARKVLAEMSARLRDLPKT